MHIVTILLIHAWNLKYLTECEEENENYVIFEEIRKRDMLVQ